MTTIDVTANVAVEIAEISGNFTNPIEVVREALHNAHDAGAAKVVVSATRQKMKDGRQALTLDIADDGLGMDQEGLVRFFGLGHSHKPKIHGRRKIGYKGHGTKIFYQAADLFVATRVQGGELLLAVLEQARNAIHSKTLPLPQMYRGQEAETIIEKQNLSLPQLNGTTIRMADFTPDSNRLIDAFKTDPIENYLHWFTVYGSFEHIVRGVDPVAPFELFLQGTDRTTPRAVPFGHPWPKTDSTDLRQLKSRDPRRPFNYFCKTFCFPDHPIEGGYTIDVVAAFEGKSARLERDRGVSRQRVGGLYPEEERLRVVALPRLHPHRESASTGSMTTTAPSLRRTSAVLSSLSTAKNSC